MESDGKPARGTFVQAMKAVSWAFFGIRKQSDLDNDASTLTLGQVIVAGLVGAGLFVAAIVTMVKLVTS
ncbi:MAG TPA: DUF2970 domain-containing protein [Nitrosospira sp.]|nr:DUF2970 domain-containing protein [Nitrosospira sp.]